MARLAGVPEAVLARARELSDQLMDADITLTVKDLAGTKKNRTKAPHYDEVDLSQMSLFDTVKNDAIIEEIDQLDISNLTPVEALNTLYRLQNKIKNRW